MVIFLAVGCKKVILDKGKALFMNFQGKSETQWLIKINCRNIQSIQHTKMNHAYCIGLNLGWKKMRIQLALNKTSCPNPQPLTH